MRTPLGWHLMLRLEDDRVLTPSTAARRLLAATVLRVARRFQLLAFRAADTHLHIELAGSREDAGELARRVGIGLQRGLRPGARFQPVHARPIADQRQLQNAFAYVLRQDQRHGLPLDPLHEASNIPDLPGFRVSGAWTCGVVRESLPRVGRRFLVELVEHPALLLAATGTTLESPSAPSVGFPPAWGRRRWAAGRRGSKREGVEGRPREAAGSSGSGNPGRLPRGCAKLWAPVRP